MWTEKDHFVRVVVKNLLMLLLKIIALNIWIKIERKGKIDNGK